MANKKISVPEKVKDIALSNPAQHIINIFKAGLATAPFCGGIASLISDYIPSVKQKRLEHFTEQIANDLEKLKDKVDENKLLTDEFAFIFEKTFKGIAENYQSEKLEAFRGIILNSAIGTSLSEEEKEYFLNLVNTLSVLHLRILKFMAIPHEYLAENGIDTTSIHGGFSVFFPIAIPGISFEIIKSAFGDLYQYGLINTDKGIFATMTSSQGLDLLGDRVSILGKQFIEFCRKPDS